MAEENSILDKIIKSKEIEEIERFRPLETVENLFKFLSNREKDVLRRRFGLLNEKKQTLEDIGAAYKVTRERIRQIESLAIKKILKLGNFQQITQQLLKTITAVLQKHGGIMQQDSLLRELLKLTNDTDENRRSVLFLCEKIFPQALLFSDESKQLFANWRLPQVSIAHTEEVVGELVEVIRKLGKPVGTEGIITTFKQTPYFSSHALQLSDDAIIAHLELSRNIAQNPYEEFGLREWGSVAPRRMNDKIGLILKKQGKPMHFIEIADMINAMKFDDRIAYPPTVHNELILNKEYVLVGRGIYALREWGYQPGVVADVITEILQKSDSPMSRQAIVQAVLQKRMVKKNTIHLALTNKHKFKKLPDGTYTFVPQQ